MTHFDQAFAHLLKVEGGYSNHPADRGGATVYGITEAVARQEGYQGPMQSLPLSAAQSIYKRRYWDPLCLDAIAAQSESVAL
jgi:lysozyme family protein